MKYASVPPTPRSIIPITKIKFFLFFTIFFHSLLSNNYKVARDSNNTPLFCYKVEKVDITGSSNSNKTYKGAYYTVATFVNIDIPIFNKIFSTVGNIFMVKGETALIYSSGINYEGLDDGSCSI